MHRRPPLQLAATLLAGLALTLLPGAAGAEDGPIALTSRVVYDIRSSGEGPVRVSWDVSVVNNDPATDRNAGDGRIAFYETLRLPILRGATALVANSSEGAPLAVEPDEPGAGPAVGATINFDRRLFYHDSYAFTLSYELSDVRQQSLLVTPSYVFLPLVAAGDQSTVSVRLPPADSWTNSVEAVDCPQTGDGFSCQGSRNVYLAATAEASRAGATAARSFGVPLGDKTVGVALTYFQGDEASAQHLQDVVTGALLPIQNFYGVPYPGTASINISQGGRQAVLGYEGLTTCHAGNDCSIVVSPVADDLTVIHEAAHLWSNLYDKRWLSEGFAQLAGQHVSGQLPAGLFQAAPAPVQPPAVDIQLDDWGEVTSVIGADQSQLAVEAAGYDRSLRFLDQLRFNLGLDTLQKVNQAIAKSGQPADSRRFFDLAEQISGRNLDDLFQLWVFPQSLAGTLAQRRQALDRLDAVSTRAADAGLSAETPDGIRQQVEAWQFADALAALDRAEAGLDRLDDIHSRLEWAKTSAAAASLTFPDTIDAAIRGWDFDAAAGALDGAARALDAYSRAATRLRESRSLWQQFGLLGKDPGGDLRRAAGDFSRGDFEASLGHSQDAVRQMDNAPDVALRRLVIVGGLLAAFAALIGMAIWASRLRERGLAEP